MVKLNGLLVFFAECFICFALVWSFTECFICFALVWMHMTTKLTASFVHMWISLNCGNNFFVLYQMYCELVKKSFKRIVDFCANCVCNVSGASSHC